MAAMMHHRPSTPHSNEMYPHGLHYLVHHNATTPNRNGNRGNYNAPSHTASVYGSPALLHEAVPPKFINPYPSQNHEDHQYPDLPDIDAVDLGIHYGGYVQGSSEYYPAEELSYNRINYPSNGLRENTPHTPKPTASDNSRRTRSGRTIVRSNSPQVSKRETSKSRISKSPKPKTPKQRAIAAKTPKLDKPLSELTKDMTNVPVRDIEEWVNRPAEVRRKEVEKRNGYVTRPMNSFMLYRSAYAERTKMWCLQNNHQVVSSVSGESWPLEPPEVREQYNEYARIERLNHANAHPDYKFSPSKGPGATARRKKTDDSSDDEDADDAASAIDPADADSEWKPRGGDHRSRRRHQAKEPSPFTAPSNNHVFESPHFDTIQHHPSSWGHQDFQHPPSIHQATDIYSRGQYYHAHPTPRELPYYNNPSLSNMMPSGLPGGGAFHPDLLQMQSLQLPYEQQVDPLLLQLESGTGFGGGIAGVDMLDPMFDQDGATEGWVGDAGAHFAEWMAGMDGE